jgi:hypothetical protein
MSEQTKYEQIARWMRQLGGRRLSSSPITGLTDVDIEAWLVGTSIVMIQHWKDRGGYAMYVPTVNELNFDKGYLQGLSEIAEQTEGRERNG